MNINPDFVTVDEIVPPGDLEDITGWTNGRDSEQEAIDKESRMFSDLQKDMPVAFRERPARQFAPELLRKWQEFQKAKGRYDGSNDLSLLDEFVTGADLAWLPQIIGSCVMSNTFRVYVTRMMIEIILMGQPEEFLGRKEFGTDNYSFYCPFTYGMARRRANMRGGDGLYCEPMAESLMKDGVLPCDNPKLIELTKRLGVDSPRDYPEPQSKSVYRAFGDWKYLDELSPYADFPVLEIVMVESADQLWQLQLDNKPCFVCSMEALHKVGEHKDGFPIHKRNPRDQWPHNMYVNGCFVASDEDRFFRWGNKSWGAKHIYNRPFDDVDESFRARRLTMAAIGEIRGPLSAMPLAG